MEFYSFGMALFMAWFYYIIFPNIHGSITIDKNATVSSEITSAIENITREYISKKFWI